MRWHALIFAALLCCAGCGTQKKISGDSSDTRVVYIETETLRTDTVRVEVPREVVRNQLPYLDTLIMSTSVAEAWATVDTIGWMLTGELRNKPTKLSKEIQIVERTIRKDSIIVQEKHVEVPVEVRKEVVPRWCWWLLFANIVLVFSYFCRRFIATKLNQ